jgi:hypothetical protein
LKLISSEILGEGTENILLREIKIILLRVKDFFCFIYDFEGFVLSLFGLGF